MLNNMLELVELAGRDLIQVHGGSLWEKFPVNEGQCKSPQHAHGCLQHTGVTGKGRKLRASATMLDKMLVIDGGS